MVIGDGGVTAFGSSAAQDSSQEQGVIYSAGDLQAYLVKGITTTTGGSIPAYDNLNIYNPWPGQSYYNYYWWPGYDSYARDMIQRLLERVEALENERDDTREKVALELLMSIDPEENPEGYKSALRAAKLLLGKE